MLKQFSSVRFYHWCDFFFKLSAVFRIVVSTLPPGGGGHLRKFFLPKNRALSFSVNQLFERRDLFHALYSCLTLIKKNRYSKLLFYHSCRPGTAKVHSLLKASGPEIQPVQDGRH